jgi:cellulose synthase/poly-beta-1,6-N-acetylglucosamine synthase-like glycosyltransferase
VRLIFWLSLAGLFYTYAGYPALAWLLARLRPRRWTAAPITPGVSVVLAVHNGATRLEGQIERLLALDYPNIKEVIIVSDGSTDGTAEWLARQRHPRLTTIILKEHSGKAAAVNAGMSRATAEVILFVDIRPEIAPGAVGQLVSNFADPKVGCVTGELVLRHASHDAASAAVGGIYWRYEKWIRACESIFSSPVGVYGGFYAIRRELAMPQPPGMILDDMFQPLAIIRQGYRSVLDPRACVYDTWPARIEAEFHRKVRTLAGNFQLFQLAPWTLSWRNPVFFNWSRTSSRAWWRLICRSCCWPPAWRWRAVRIFMRPSPFCRFLAGRSRVRPCASEFPCSIGSRPRPARCWCSRRRPSPGFTNFFLPVARFGRSGPRISRWQGLLPPKRRIPPLPEALAPQRKMTGCRILLKD